MKFYKTFVYAENEFVLEKPPLTVQLDTSWDERAMK